MDLNAACSGFLYGLAVADQMVRTGVMRRVLLIGAEKLHYFLDFTDRATSVLFGDGAGAVVVEACEEEGGLLAFELGADGTAAEILCIPGSGTEGDPGAAHRPAGADGGPDRVPPGRGGDGGRRAAGAGEGRARPGAKSTCSYRTRPTCASSKPPPAGWGSTRPGWW